MSPSPVLALVRDLIFASRITQAASDAGTPVKVVRDPDRLAGEPGRLLIVDLNLAGAIPAAARWGAEHVMPVVGFVSHVDAQTIQLARAAGIPQVLARSRFAQILPTLFTR